MTNNACTIKNCSDKHFGHGYCNKHYKRWRRTEDPLGSTRKTRPLCTVKDCDRPNRAKGFCGKHYTRFLKYGDPNVVKFIKGEGSITKGGYRILKINGRAIFEHRYVMEQKLGRELFSNENVHHINGDKLDNRVENLELWVTSQPSGQRVEDLLEWAHQLIERYENAIPYRKN